MKPSKAAALCGISTALGSVALILARFDLPVTLSLYVISSIAVMIPLSRMLYKGAALTVLATAVVAFLSGGIFVLLPYIMFFGIHPLLSALFVKIIRQNRAGKLISLFIKIIIFIALYFIAINIAAYAALIPQGIDYNILALLLIGIFVPYDYFMRLMQSSVAAFVNRHLKM